MNWTEIRLCNACGAGCPSDASQCIRCNSNNLGPIQKREATPHQDNQQQRFLSKTVRPIEIVDGFSILDGGTTGLTLYRNGCRESYVFDYSLPDDGRLRFITHTAKADRKLAPDGAEERQLYLDLRQSLDEEYGKSCVDDIFRDPCAFTIEEPWCSAVLFLNLMQKEREWCQPFFGRYSVNRGGSHQPSK